MAALSGHAGGGPPTLSLVVPVYNEGATLEYLLKRLGEVAFPVPWELIVVDDGSDDGATDRIDRDWIASAERAVVIRGRRNQGKGAAVRRGLAEARGQLLAIQDADLEYDPRQLPRLLEPLLEGRAQAVFGTREFGAHASYSFWYVVGNRLISLLASAMFNRYITDAYTCYKLFTRDVYERMHLTADGFEIEAELTGGLLRECDHVFEIPIDYVARTREEGKKIRALDGLRGLTRLARVRLLGW
ncbi:MAG TPA: glycosyltransferase family 2 protein [Nitriliruptorales bacterium]